MKIIALVTAMRPRQWVKNLFVAAPVVFAKHLGDGHAALRALVATALFCALSSAVYLWNDVVDIERDRAHPHKHNRPIAAGRLSIRSAESAAALLASSALIFGYLLDPRFLAAALAYLLLNVAYSFRLKRIIYVDVLAIAAGFLLRVLGGAFAVDVETSPYLLWCTALLATFLGLGKRAHELEQLGKGGARQRESLRGYRLEILRPALFLTSAATLFTYLMYTRAAHTVSFFHTARMIWTAPFAAYGLGRFLWLVLYRPGRPSTDSPTEEMLKDPAFMLNLAVWGVVTIAIIYFRP